MIMSMRIYGAYSALIKCCHTNVDHAANSHFFENSHPYRGTRHFKESPGCSIGRGCEERTVL